MPLGNLAKRPRSYHLFFVYFHAIFSWAFITYLRRKTSSDRFYFQVINLIDLSSKITQERLESLLYKLKWSQFTGVQMLLLKVTFDYVVNLMITGLKSRAITWRVVIGYLGRR